MLNAVHRLVSVYLFLRDGILTMPIQQEREAVGGEVRGRRAEHLRPVAGIEAIGAVSRYHIKERAREVTFVVIVRLIDGTYSTGDGGTEFA